MTSCNQTSEWKNIKDIKQFVTLVRGTDHERRLSFQGFQPEMKALFL